MRYIFIALTVVLAGSAFLYARNVQIIGTQSSIKIGAVLPMTGVGATYGEHQKNGILLAQEEINATGGINGHKLEIIIEDDQTDPKQTVSAVRKLISVDKTELVIGGVWGFLANAAIPIIEENDAILFSTSVSVEELEYLSDSTFLTYGSIESNQENFRRFLSQFGKPKVVTIAWQNPWGKGHLKAFDSAVKRAGGEVVHEIVLPNPDNNDLKTQFARIKKLNPDVLMIALNPADSVEFLKLRTELAIDAPALSYSTHLYSKFVSGDIPPRHLTNVYLFGSRSSDEAFTKRYTERFGIVPGADADGAYDAVKLLAQAIKMSNGSADTHAIAVALKSIKDFRGASGRIGYVESNYPKDKEPVLTKFDGTSFSEI